MISGRSLLLVSGLLRAVAGVLLGCAVSWAFAEELDVSPGEAPPSATPAIVDAAEADDPLLALLTQREAAGQHSCIPLELWCRLRTGFGMPNIDDPEVERQMSRLLQNPRALERRLAQGRLYLPDIVAAVEDAGMPAELALLPFIESGFNPAATSPARAAGLWQFIPATGQRFGLAQNWLLDERRSIRQATRSALTYLKQLHDEFHDWALALAAYNWGEGNVRRAVARSGRSAPAFANLRWPAETRAYVPRLFALKRLIAEPERYGLHLPEIDDDERLVNVQVSEPIDVATAASLAGITVATFRAYNPGLLRPVIPTANYGAATFVLPEAAASSFQRALPGHRGPLSAWVLVHQPRTETLRSIAGRHGITAETLRRANGLPHGAITLVAASTLLLPRDATRRNDAMEVTIDAPGPTGADRAPVRVTYSRPVPSRIHVVRRGETLKAIARQYRADIGELRKLNQLPRRASAVTAGSRLIVSRAIPPRPRYVPTESGDLHPAARIVHAVGRSL